MQRGLLDALLGIGLVSAGAGALNEALERRTDARMKRTEDRPIGRGAHLAGRGGAGRTGRAGLGAVWLAAAHQSAYGGAGAADGFYLCGHLHAAQAGDGDGDFYRRISRRDGAAAGLDRGAGADRVAGGGALRDSLCLAVSSFHVDCVVVSRGLCARRNQHASCRPAGRMVHRGARRCSLPC